MYLHGRKRVISSHGSKRRASRVCKKGSVPVGKELALVMVARGELVVSKKGSVPAS